MGFVIGLFKEMFQITDDSRLLFTGLYPFFQINFIDSTKNWTTIGHIQTGTLGLDSNRRWVVSCIHRNTIAKM